MLTYVLWVLCLEYGPGVGVGVVWLTQVSSTDRLLPHRCCPSSWGSLMPCGLTLCGCLDSSMVQCWWVIPAFHTTMLGGGVISYVATFTSFRLCGLDIGRMFSTVGQFTYGLVRCLLATCIAACICCSLIGGHIACPSA